MKWKLLGFGIICLILLGACGNSSSGVKIDSVTLARDDGSGKPGETVTSFRPSDRTFYVLVKLDRLETGLKVKVSWVAVAAAGSTNQVLAEREFSALTANTIRGDITLPNDWPTGKYRVDIYVNDSLQKSVDFTVA